MRTRRQNKKGYRSGGARSTTLNLVALMDIFTILVFFLLVNSVDVQETPTASVDLPDSVADGRPRQTVTVTVTGEEILVEGTRVAALADFISAPAEASQALRGALGALGEEVREAAEVTILGDRQLPFRLLKTVMAACTEAGFGRVSLAVTQKTPEGGA